MFIIGDRCKIVGEMRGKVGVGNKVSVGFTVSVGNSVGMDCVGSSGLFVGVGDCGGCVGCDGEGKKQGSEGWVPSMKNS